MNKKVSAHDSSLGMSANILAMLAYLATLILSFIPIVKHIAWFAPLILFFVEKRSPFVSWHCMQAFLLNVLSSVLSIIWSILTAGLSMGGLLTFGMFGFGFGIAVVGLIYTVVSIVVLVYSIIAIVKAYGYTVYHIPLLGDITDRLTGNKV